MASENIVPIQLELTSGTYYTLWAPTWRERGEEWQAFLGKGDSLFFFESPVKLLAFLNSEAEHDLTSHPKWGAFCAGTAEQKAQPRKKHVFDLVGLPAQLALRPEAAAVDAVERNFEIMQSLGRVLGLGRIVSVFQNYSLLGNIVRGPEHYSGDEGLGEWSAVGATILSNWGEMLDALENETDEDRAPIFVTPEVSEAEVEQAQEQIDAAVAAREEKEKAAAEAAEKAREEAEAGDPYDSSPWAAAGIDPIKIVIDGKILYTLRCYVDEAPIFLGKFGEIFTFNSGRALVRWMVDHKDHDLAKLSTWGDLVDLANTGELKLDVHESNTYVFSGLEAAIAKGPNAVDTKQLGQAYEVIADAADWAGDDAVNAVLLAVPEIQEYIGYMMGNHSAYVPSSPYTTEVDGFKQLKETLTNRFSKF